VLIARLWPGWREALVIVRPETVLAWHRQGFRLFWRRKSQAGKTGRPEISAETIALIRRMNQENPLWGAPRIHDRRRIQHIGVTHHPTSAWTAQQTLEAFPWNTTPRYLIRDRDGIYSGSEFGRMLGNLEIEDTPTAPRSPWQNPYVERVIGSIRRECTDHVIAINERQLIRVLRQYQKYYNASRTHLGIGKDAPDGRAVEAPDIGKIVARPVLGGLHHRYLREAA
jgi:hypothetical protein